ncbi:GNAT family N-acetyltransferase [Paenibacillus agricola]|uniref:GNAT family N-acetyltransferase n=1 Tax=Paenibacillus agricola TaxID=2716264 RepID=A0ABX0JJ62_9BACL|nr:GNAT family N-acetyltransferase [Paenibacillus agricola]NHN35449.1 GNAT family N-acetyltransferase [Paenibacillus agricola]
MGKIDYHVLNENHLSLITKMLSECAPLKYAQSDTPETLQKYIEQGQLVLGLFDNNELIAYAILSMRMAEDLEEFFQKYNLITDRKEWGHVGTLLNCVVKDEYRGYGLQKYLIELRETVAKNSGYNEIFTSVHERNIYSINNLKKAGYKQCGRHHIGGEWLLFGKALEGPTCFVVQD